MDFISGLVLILLTLVGYSSGCVLAGWGYRIAPGLRDLAVTLGLWIGALASRDLLSKWWAILVWLVVGGMTGALMVISQRSKLALTKTIYPNLGLSQPETEGKFLSWLWQRWKAFASELGDFQGRILLAWFYFVIVTPFGLLVRLLSDPLKLRIEQKTTGWVNRPVGNPDLDNARRQY
jgi:hypothetical protein